jgi:hypothetical protein
MYMVPSNRSVPFYPYGTPLQSVRILVTCYSLVPTQRIERCSIRLRRIVITKPTQLAKLLPNKNNIRILHLFVHLSTHATRIFRLFPVLAVTNIAHAEIAAYSTMPIVTSRNMRHIRAIMRTGTIYYVHNHLILGGATASRTPVSSVRGTRFPC